MTALAISVNFPGDDLLSRLPEVRGKLTSNEPLSEQTWFRVGGPAEVMFRPADEDDLAHFMANCPDDVPVTFIGVASNLLIRDGGIPGVVIRLGPQFARITVEASALTVGAGAMDVNVARTAQTSKIAGLEFLSGIPGTVGGGLRMNAGAYGKEFKDVVTEATVIDRAGQRVVLTNEQIGFGYRRTKIPEDVIFVSAVLQGEEGDPAAIQKKMQEIKNARESTQPIKEKTGGSTFANPDDDHQNRKSWQLIELAGCKGLRVGGAQVSEKHCNFLINTGGATAADIEKLGEDVRRRVREKFGVTLRWEIKRVGVPVEARESPRR